MRRRIDVIDQSTLFVEGDVYDPARLAESERNLRSLGFLRSVSISPGPPVRSGLDASRFRQRHR